jgi:hypothetical protein
VPPDELLQDLLNRVRILTARFGFKAALSREFGIPQQRITDWLAGRRDPSAEQTLLLLKWVTAQEAKKESLGGAETPPRPKTRKPKPHTTNEEPKQSDQKES